MDYIENLEKAPQNVQEIINSYADKLENEGNPYFENSKTVVDELKQIGWKVDYNFIGELYDLRPANPMTKQCNEILRLIDKGYSYKDALNTVLRDSKGVYAKSLEDEVKSYV